MFKGKKSFFTELLISFLLLLCIPIITILLIFWQSNRIVKAQVQDIESKSLHLYVEQLEEVMGGMKDICHTLYSSEYCRLYASNNEVKDTWSYDLRNKVLNTLQSLDKSYYYDIFVYCYNDRVISSRYGSVNVEDYYATYYSDIIKDKQLTEAFLKILKTDYIKPKCHVINEGDENPFLCMTMGVRNKKSSQLNYTVCVVLNPEYLDQLLVMQKASADSVFQIYNTDRQLMFSNHPQAEEAFPAEDELWENPKRDIWMDRKEYMVQIKESEYLDNYYIYAVSKEVFWSTLSGLRIWGYMGAGLCMLISILFAYRSAVRAYRPVGNIMEHLNHRKDNTLQQTATSEFSHIMSFMENQEKALKEKRKISREWFLHGLLEGKDKNVNAEMLEENNIVFQNDKFLVCIIQAEILQAEMEDLSSFTVQNVLEELCGMVGKAYFVGFSKNRYALLINLSATDNELYDVLQQGQEFLRQKFQIVLSIGCSECHEGIQAIPEAYKEAQEAIRYRFLKGSGKLISYKDIKTHSAGYRNDEESKVYMLLLEYVESKKEEMDLNTFVEQLMYIYQMNEEMSVDVALVFKNEIVSALGRIMELCGFTEEETRGTRKNMKNAATLSDFQQQLSECIAELCKRSVKKRGNEDVLEELKRLIEANYTDGELSIAMLGAKIGMQPAHMSKIFKEKYGISLLDYIANIRVQHAKRLLREGKGSIQEIGEKVGFLSSQVFIRTFKKKEGITPGKYREMAEKG